MEALLTSLALSLGLTLLLELGVAALLGLRKDLLLVGLVNVLTNPPLVLILSLTYLHTGTTPWYLVAPLELLVFAAEGLLYRNRTEQKRWNPFLLSLMLNAISYFGGLLLS